MLSLKRFQRLLSPSFDQKNMWTTAMYIRFPKQRRIATYYDFKIPSSAISFFIVFSSATSPLSCLFLLRRTDSSVSMSHCSAFFLSLYRLAASTFCCFFLSFLSFMYGVERLFFRVL